jgi:hypothetical protein
MRPWDCSRVKAVRSCARRFSVVVRDAAAPHLLTPFLRRLE